MRRPTLITLIAFAVLSLAAYNAGRAAVAIQATELLLSLGLVAPQRALVVTGVLWALGWGVAAVGLFRLRRWARSWTPAAMVLYQANLWLVRLTLEKSPNEPLTRPADAAVSILSIAVVWAVLRWSRVRRAFL